jgi:hypothetical protein
MADAAHGDDYGRLPSPNDDQNNCRSDETRIHQSTVETQATATRRRIKPLKQTKYKQPHGMNRSVVTSAVNR